MIPLADESSTEIETADSVFPEVALWVANVLWQLKHEDKSKNKFEIKTAIKPEIAKLGVELLQKRGWNVKFVESSFVGADRFEVTRP